MSRPSFVDDCAAARVTLTQYVALCDVPRVRQPVDFEDLFTQDAIWEGVGPRYAAKFGAHHGRPTIVAALTRMLDEEQPFTFNVHALTTEHFLLDADGLSGSWLMFQATTDRAGHSHMALARLGVRFRFEQARWRIARFTTCNLMSIETPGGLGVDPDLDAAIRS